uniref:Bzip protein n=1 Tax=Rodentolepis nana TaxID=102285 RepID=A0A0R3TGI3_RODNA
LRLQNSVVADVASLASSAGDDGGCSIQMGLDLNAAES